MEILQKIVNAFYGGQAFDLDQGQVISIDDLKAGAYAGQQRFSDYDWSIYDGGKFAGDFGETQIQHIDYWTLRARSAQLFNENHYAKGIVRRLVTNVINTGLSPEAVPDEIVLGRPEGSLGDWTDDVESRAALWGKSPQVCDWKKRSTFGAIQREAYREALIEGDVLVVLRSNPRTRAPMVQLIRGASVMTPWTQTPLRPGHEIKHGVEFDSVGRDVAFHVRQGDGTFKRLPAWGEKSGRRLAWLVFGTEKRLDEVRGQPLLSVVMQSLKEIDRYRDSAQRKAVINSILAMVITKDEDKPGTLPMTGAAKRRDSVDVRDNTTGSTPRRFNLGQYDPGVIVEEMQQGENVVMKGGEGTDINFHIFEDAVLSSVAWSLELPPEIVKLSFSNNYSASQAAINEVKIAINLKWGDWGETFCSPIYLEWLISEVIAGRIEAPGLLEAWRDPSQHDILAAWAATEWYGSIKPSTDMLKQAKSSIELVNNGWSNNAREARILTGTKFNSNLKRLKRENELKAEAMRPMLELKQEFGGPATDEAARVLYDTVTEAVSEGLQAES